MMKKISTLCIIFITVNVFSQRIVEKSVGSFNTIKVFDLIEVNLIQSDENKILVKGERIDEIRWVNKNGTLKLRMQLDKKFKGDDTFIEVHYTSLEVIDSNEGAIIVCNELIEQDKITLRVQEGASIKIGMNVGDVDIRSVTGGIVEASGIATNQNIVLNTGGVFQGRDLKTKRTNIKISAGGEAELFATERVDVKIRAGGDVHVYGNPKEVNKSTFAGGRVYVK